MDGRLYQEATLLDILAYLANAGLGSRPVSDRNLFWYSVDDALAVAQSAYKMSYRAAITPKSLAPVLDLLGGQVISYSERRRPGRQIVFTDKFNGVLADAHLLPARRGSAAKRDALDHWQYMLPAPTPTFDSELQSFVAAPTDAGLEMLRLLKEMGG